MQLTLDKRASKSVWALCVEEANFHRSSLLLLSNISQNHTCDGHIFIKEDSFLLGRP